MNREPYDASLDALLLGSAWRCLAGLCSCFRGGLIMHPDESIDWLECRMTSDGYKLYRLPTGLWVDSLDPETRDFTFVTFPDDEVSDESRSYGPWGQR